MHKRNIYLILLIITLIFIIIPISQSLSCSITANTSCTDANKIFLYMKNDTAGYNNAHGALYNASSGYPYVLCCNSSDENEQISNNCSANYAMPFLNLYGTTNSHVQEANLSSYTNKSCMKVPKYNVSVNYRDTSCEAGETCLLSISSASNAHVANCSHYSTQVCVNLTYNNNPPIVTYINLTPLNPNTDDTLLCNFTIEDEDVGDSLYANFSWYLNGTLQPALSGQKAVINGTMNQTTLESSNTIHFEDWSCEITPYDSYDNGTANMSENVTIINTVPTVPSRITPADEDHSLTDRHVNFSWLTSTDIDEDEITYVLNITNPTASDIYDNTTNLSFVHDDDELWTDSECSEDEYTWQMKACDPYNCSDWTTFWNFSILDVLWIEDVVGDLDFGDVQMGYSYDTTNENYTAFEYENYGNVKADLYNITGDALWDQEALGTRYFQAKANWSTRLIPYVESETKTDWFNISNGNYSEILISNFSYSINKNKTLLDINIEVPMGESSGNKSSSLTLYWIQSD